MNKTLFIGRLVRDPETNQTTSGIKYARFTIAVDRGFGETKTTDFIPMVAWRNQADFIANYVKKGNLVSVEGKFTSSTFEKDGKNVTKYEILVDEIKSLESKQKDATIASLVDEVEKEDVQATKNAQQTFKKDLPWDLDL